MKSIIESVGLALQIAYEYDGCGGEHIEDMLATYNSSGDTPPCSYGELLMLTEEASKHKTSNMSFDDAEKLMLDKCED